MRLLRAALSVRSRWRSTATWSDLDCLLNCCHSLPFLLSWESKDKKNCHLFVLICWCVGVSPCWTQSLEKFLSNVYTSSWCCGQSKCYFHLLSAQPAPAHTDHLLSSHSLFHLCFPSLACLFTCHWDTLRLPSNRSVDARSRWNKLNYLPGQLLAHTAIRSRHLASQRTISKSMSPCQTPLLYCTCSKERCVKEV